MTLIFERTSDVTQVRQALLDIHVDVRGDFGMLERPFHRVERFAERLETYAARQGWVTVIGYEGDEPVGFVFGVPLAADTKWWSSMKEPLPQDYAEESGARTFAVQEICVRGPWRGSAGEGTSRLLHDQILTGRTEERATLLVDPAAGGGGVKRVYESWGYEQIGTQQPLPDSPVFASMMRDPLQL